MTRGRVIGILVASVLAYAAVGTRVAFGQSGFGLSGLNVSVPGVAISGIGISSTSVGLGGGGATLSLPGVSVSNLAAVTTTSVSVGGGSAAVALPGVSVTGVASVSQTTLNVSGGVATVGLPDVNVAGISLTTTQLTLNLSGEGSLLGLPELTVAVPGLPPVTLLGDDGLDDVLELLNQVSPVTEMFAGMSSAATFGPLELMLDGFAFGNSTSQDCAYTGAAGLAPLPIANVWMWGSDTVGTTEHDGYRLQRGDGGDCGAPLAFSALEKSHLPGILWDASNVLGLQRGTLHLGFTGGVTDTETQIKANGAWLGAGFTRAGAARLTSTSVGTFSLLTAGNWYAGSAIGSAWGRNESQNFLLGSSSDYDTSSVVAAGIVGRILPVTDNVRFDIRGTLAYQKTAADAHIDSLGIAYGSHTIETTDATLSGRLFGVFRQDDLTIRPYLQAGITHRLDYDNELEIDNITFTFDEAETSVFAATGLDFEISRTLQLSAGVRHEHSRDYDDLIARFGVVLRLN